MGTYAYAKLSTQSATVLHEITKKYSIPNAVRPDKFHVTVLHSRKTLDNYHPTERYVLPLAAAPKGLAIWETSTTPCLVLLLDCDDLINHHKFLMNKHQAEFDFPEYCPHVTLSYDIRNYDISAIQDIILNTAPLELTGEYSEPLDENCDIKNQTINKTVDSILRAA